MTAHFPALGFILLFPALGFLFNVFLGNRWGRSAVNVIGPGVIFAAFAVAAGAFIRLSSMPSGTVLTVTLWPWIHAGPFSADFALQMDALSALMTLIVTGVGALIHVYSIGYMAHDEDFARFFAYLNLFELSMLILVLANNLPLLFMGWEGVGLCSYLLVSFWYTVPANAYAGRKAFVANRIGDAGFLLGMFTIVSALGAHGIWSLDFSIMHDNVGVIAPTTVTLAAVFLFIGATGKSAQIPLYVWLPDAMAGPTPVSALLHAATMVTAGVYLIARTHVLFSLAPPAQFAVAVVGAVTLLLAGFSALTQHDIKRVLAYSTMSQIGYMFLALGVGAWQAAMFHFVTHAFFKALLFLGAGVIINALDDEHSIFRMGGLRKEMPVAFWTFLIAGCSLAGLPFLTSGFFSKDLIIWEAWSAQPRHPVLWIAGMTGALLTSLYIFRVIFRVFFGPLGAPVSKRPGYAMTVPLLVLAFLAIVGGYLKEPLLSFLHSVLPAAIEA